MSATRKAIVTGVAVIGASAAAAAVVGIIGNGGTRAAAQAGSAAVGEWLQNTASSHPLDTRSFEDIIGSSTQTGAGAPHAITVRAVARVVAKPGSTTIGTIDVTCELSERPAGNVIDRVHVTARPRQRTTLVHTAVAILNPGGSVIWRCRQHRTSATHLVRLEHGRLIDVVVGNGIKRGPDAS